MVTRRVMKKSQKKLAFYGKFFFFQNKKNNLSTVLFIVYLYWTITKFYTKYNMVKFALNILQFFGLSVKNSF